MKNSIIQNGLLSQCCNSKVVLNIKTMTYKCVKCKKKCKLKNETT